MATIIPGQPGSGYYFGTGLGKGLSSGLEQLAAERAQKLQHNQSVKRFVDIGFDPREADLIARLPIEKQVEIVAATGGIASQQMPQQSGVAQLLEQVPPTQSQLLNTENPLGKLLGQQQAVQQQPSEEIRHIQQMREQIQSPQVQEAQDQSTVENKPKRSLAGALPALNKEQVKIQREEQKTADKETLPYYKEVLKADKGALENDKRLKRMEHLVSKEGGLPVAAFYKLFKDLSDVNPTHTAAAGGLVGNFAGGPVGAGIGAVAGGLIQPIATLLRYIQKQTSPNTEEYEKLTADFIRDAKNVFGARITDADLAAFMQMIPSLAVSDAGKLQIIKNMKNFNEAAHIKAKVMKDIIKENKGKRPANLEILVEERAEPELEKLAEKFTTGVESVEYEMRQKKQPVLPSKTSSNRPTIADMYVENRRR
jgi:hypothetical protein